MTSQVAEKPGGKYTGPQYVQQASIDQLQGRSPSRMLRISCPRGCQPDRRRSGTVSAGLLAADGWLWATWAATLALAAAVELAGRAGGRRLVTALPSGPTLAQHATHNRITLKGYMRCYALGGCFVETHKNYSCARICGLCAASLGTHLGPTNACVSRHHHRAGICGVQAHPAIAVYLKPSLIEQ